MGLGFALFSIHALAGSIMASEQASASLNKVCSMSSTNIAFGVMSLNAVRNYANGSINILCSNKTSYTITLSFNTKDPYNSGNGLMTGTKSSDAIVYSITSVPKGSFFWGSQSPVSGVGNGLTQTYVTYGVALTGLDGNSAYPTVDNYSDSVVATVIY